MDNVLVNFQSGIDRLDEATKQAYEGNLDDVPGIFVLMDPMPGALEAVHKPYKADSCKKVDWMKDSSLTVCGSGFCVSLASGRFRSTQLCALASRRFRSTLARLAEWCNALGNKKGKRRAATERLLATALSSPPPVFSSLSFAGKHHSAANAVSKRNLQQKAMSFTESRSTGQVLVPHSNQQ